MSRSIGEEDNKQVLIYSLYHHVRRLSYCNLALIPYCKMRAKAHTKKFNSRT